MADALDRDGVVRVVVGVFCHDGRFLLGLRPADGLYPNVWEFPGGKVEAGESDEQALRREWLEELGATCHQIGRLLYEDVFGSDHTGFSFSVASYEVLQSDGVECLVHQQLRWVTLSELKRLAVAPSLGLALKEGRHG